MLPRVSQASPARNNYGIKDSVRHTTPRVRRQERHFNTVATPEGQALPCSSKRASATVLAHALPMPSLSRFTTHLKRRLVSGVVLVPQEHIRL